MEKLGLVAQFLARRTPIHFGGMSDPFQPAEAVHGISLQYLKTLSAESYPTVISTKGVLAANEPYFSLLKSFPVVVQFSVTSTEDGRARMVEPHATPPSTMLRAMEKLSDAGVVVTCRWQPFISQIAEDPAKYIGRVADAGARHIALEHLKVPVEGTTVGLRQQQNKLLSDLRSEFHRVNAIRDGREYVLPAKEKLASVLHVRELSHRAGLTFGAADNEFLYLSDGEACCSGVDAFAGFENVFRYQISAALKRSWPDKHILFERINSEWRPEGSIDWCLNSRSRISRHGFGSGTLMEHVRRRWNEPTSTGSPTKYFGVVDTGARGSNGDRIYAWSDLAKTMIQATTQTKIESAGVI